jgi:hypothetical protein
VSAFFPEDQRVHRTWAHMKAKLAEAPRLSDQQEKNVNTVIDFFKKEVNAKKLDFDRIMTNENMQKILDYDIPAPDVPFLKERKGKTQRQKDSSEVATQKGKEKVQEGPKKPKEPNEGSKTMKKLLADAMRISGAGQKPKSMKATKKRSRSLKKTVNAPAKKRQKFEIA